MQPYYQGRGITLYHGDCLDVLPTLKPASVDLIVTDPPYGVNWQSGIRKASFDVLTNDDGDLDVRAVLDAALRTLRYSRHIYVFGPCAFDGLPIGGTCELIWDKTKASLGDLSSPWGSSHERISFGVYAPTKANRVRGDGRLAARLRKGSVLRVPRLSATAVTKHPTEKPVYLIRQLIESSSLLGETVLDPFAGSGSTLIAAAIEGRQAIGIEIDERYCAVTAERIAREVRDDAA
jgi:DNA modification methylase